MNHFSVVDKDIPVPLSKAALKSLGCTPDFNENAYAFQATNETGKLVETASGHVGVQYLAPPLAAKVADAVEQCANGSEVALSAYMNRDTLTEVYAIADLPNHFKGDVKQALKSSDELGMNELCPCFLNNNVSEDVHRGTLTPCP